MPHNNNGNSNMAKPNSVPAIVAGIVAIVLILTIAYLLMNGGFQIADNGMPYYMPNKSTSTGSSNSPSGSSSTNKSSSSKSSDSSSDSNNSSSDDSNTDSSGKTLDLGVTGNDVTVDEDKGGVDVKILQPDDSKNHDVNIGL